MASIFNSKIYFRHKFLIGAVLILVVLRTVAPTLILRQINKKFATFSPIYFIHIDDLDISLLRSAYRFEGFEVSQKKTRKIFFKADAIDISLAWRELLNLKIVTDIRIDRGYVKLDESLAVFAMNNSQQSKADAKTAQETILLVAVESLKVLDSTIEFRQVGELDVGEPWRLTEFNAIANNITSNPKNTLTLVSGSADLLKVAKVKVVADLNLQREPVEWRVESEIRGFSLPAVNSVIKSYTPLTFERGNLDVFSEIRSKDGSILGYVRPFFTDMKLMGDRADYKGPKHFFIELFGEIANFILKNREEKSVATQVDFGTRDGKIKINSAKAIELAFDHAFNENKLKKKVNGVLDISDKPERRN